MSESFLPRYQESQRLFDRASKVIPAGIYGHTSPALTVPGSFPYFAQKAEGCRYWDADGNEFIDYLCGYGPVVLAHNHPEVEEEVARQQRDGNCFNHPTKKMVELAEKLVGLVDFADWAVFGKNGSDMTSWAVQVARAFTHRKKILRVSGSYHGIAPWCNPGHAGWIEEDREHIHEFKWNDLNSLHDLIKKYDGQIAGLITCAFHHPSYASSEMPAPGFFKEMERICRQHGILLILDDIRSGFRLDLGGSHRYFDFTPDISCYCKALGNGHPISAAVGQRGLRVAASKVFLTGSYWNSAVPMAASWITLKILERENCVAKMARMGELLMNGLTQAAKESGFTVICSGPPAIPFMMFTDDPGLCKQQLFCVEMAKRGVFLHPHHNWFMCAAHEESDIQQTLQKAREVFQMVKEALE